MADTNFDTKVFLKNTASPVTVRVTAFNYSQAMKIIEGMYGDNFKSLYLQPYEVK